MKAFIRSSAAISPQNSILEEFPWSELKYYENYFTAVEPVYKEYIPAMKLRRMSRLVKMSLISALACLKDSGIDVPGAIITASGWGCLADTYKYLEEITNDSGLPPSPATFIQSTHNTPGGQIALHLNCQNYNNVIVNGNTSFEYALSDALLLLEEGRDAILLGGYDEITPIDFELKERSGYWKKTDRMSKAFLESEGIGTMAGEGATFFLLTKNAEGATSEVKTTKILNCPPDNESFEKALKLFLEENDLTLKDIDLVLSGANGDSRVMPYYKELYSSIFNGINILEYKWLCGEYDTASAFALWLANELVKAQTIPAGFNIKSTKPDLKNLLIFNYAGSHKHALTLVSKTGL